MTKKQKPFQNSTLVKTAVSKSKGSKDVNIVKHFQPNVPYNKQHSNCELPEINCDVDIKQRLQILTGQSLIRNSKDKKQEKNKKEYTQNEIISKAAIITCRKRRVDTDTANKSTHYPNSLKSKSYVESTRAVTSISRDQSRERPKAAFSNRSKSFTTDSRKIAAKSINSINAKHKKSSFVSSSSSGENETYINKLQKEISLNKNSNERNKLYLTDNKIHNEKVESLRGEIGKLINLNLVENKKHLTELKAEISHYRRNEIFSVYNVHNQVNIDQNGKNVPENNANPKNLPNSNTECAASSTNGLTGPEFIREQYEHAEENEEVINVQQLFFQKDDQASSSEKKSCTSVESDHTQEGLHDQDIKTLSKMEFLRCLESTPQDEYIKSKIYEANVLIDRVKNTLTDIKNKTQPRDSGIDADNKNMEDEALISHIEYDVKTTDNDEWNRPKTRRNSISPEDSVSLRSKFICKPEEMLPHDTQLAACNECIKALEDATVSERPKTRRISSRPVPTVERSEEVISRSPDDTQIAKLQEFIEDGICGQLNTITEQTESEISSTASECKEVANTMKVTKSTSQNTDTLVKDSKEVQVFMSVEVLTAGCQIMQPQSDSTTQTEKQNKHLCAENVCASQIGSTRSNHLGVQILPSVNIIHYDDGLIIQNILNFYIDGRGKTYVNKASNAKNVGFFVSKSHDTHARFQVKEYLTASTAEMQPKIKQESHIKAISSTSIKLVISDYVNDKSPEQSSSDCTIYDIKNMKQPKELAKSRSSETPSKHLVLKSFQLYDNPNVHDPGEMIPILRVSNMDTTVYKTFINPEGIPRHMSHPSVSEIPSSNIVSPEILRKISSFRFYQPRKHHASTDYKASSRSSEKQYSKLVDVGLYTSKSTQCQLNFSNQFDDELTKEDLSCKEVIADKSSYEKISITISYSTEETISGESSSSKEIKPERSSKQEKEITVHEPEIISTRPLNKSEVIESYIGTRRQNTNAKPQSTTSPRNTFKSIRSKLQDMNPELVVSGLCEPELDTISTDSTVLHFISGLTTTTSSDIKKVLPHIRKSLVKDKGTPTTSKNDYTALPVQVHGDCIPDDYIIKTKHLDLAKNGRYKDEENLFCETFVPRSLENSSPKRRALRYKPNNYVNTHLLDLSNSGTLTLEDPGISEGEIKCKSTTSLGEVHKCNSLNPIDGRLPSAIKNYSTDPNVTIRQKRSYFNHWVTYYINKNTHNSSSSSKN